MTTPRPHIFVNKKIYHLLIALLVLLPGCLGPGNYRVIKRIVRVTNAERSKVERSNVDPLAIAAQAPMLTIWVHGAKFFPIEQRVCPLGMSHVLTLPKGAVIRQFAETVTQEDPVHFSTDHFYAFGWSGTLSFKKREEAAYDLYQAINKLMRDYRSKHWLMRPRIRIIGYSHGGNVALNLARVKDSRDTQLSIDELLLIAVPVQNATKDLLKDPLFKSIYSIYTRQDLGQIGDPQGLYTEMRNFHERQHTNNEVCTCSIPLLSGREFPPQKNLVQARIKINGSSLKHMEFPQEHVARLLPRILQEIDQSRANTAANESDPVIHSLFLRV